MHVERGRESVRHPELDCRQTPLGLFRRRLEETEPAVEPERLALIGVERVPTCRLRKRHATPPVGFDDDVRGYVVLNASQPLLPGLVLTVATLDELGRVRSSPKRSASR